VLLATITAGELLPKRRFASAPPLGSNEHELQKLLSAIQQDQLRGIDHSAT